MALPARSRVRGGRISLCRGMFTSKPLAAGVAVLVGLLGIVLLVYAFTQPPSAPRAPSGVADAGETLIGLGSSNSRLAAVTSSSVAGERLGVEDLIVGPVLPASDPLSVSIPRLHVGSRLVRLGMDDRRAMQVPLDAASAGWYRLGPTPGELGPAVIAGHVTWNQVPVFSFGLPSWDAVIWWRWLARTIGWRCSRSRMSRSMRSLSSRRERSSVVSTTPGSGSSRVVVSSTAPHTDTATTSSRSPRSTLTRDQGSQHTLIRTPAGSELLRRRPGSDRRCAGDILRVRRARQTHETPRTAG